MKYSRASWFVVIPILVAGSSALANPVTDPTGDEQDVFGAGGFLPDITSMSLSQDGTTATFTIVFAQNIAAPSAMTTNSVAGFVEIDTDQSSATGVTPGQNGFSEFTKISGFGSDVFIDIFNEISTPGFAPIFDNETFAFLGEATMDFSGNTCSGTFNQSIIGSSPVNFLTLVGSFAQPTDALSQFGTSRPEGGLTGDYNGDSVVDSVDYAIWRESLGQTGSGLAADGNGDMVVDSIDYALWRENFGSGGTPAPDGDSPNVQASVADNSGVLPGDDTVSPEFNGAFDGDGTHYTFGIVATPPTGGPTGTTTIVGGAMTVDSVSSGYSIYYHPTSNGVVQAPNPSIPAAAFTTGVRFNPDGLTPHLSKASIFDPTECFVIFGANSDAMTLNASSPVALTQVTVAQTIEGANGPALAMVCQPMSAPMDTEGNNVIASIVVELAALGAAGVGPPLYNCDIFTSAGPADLNGDGFVNGADLANLLANWGVCGAPCPPPCAADLTGDCIVDGADLAQLLANWTG